MFSVRHLGKEYQLKESVKNGKTVKLYHLDDEKGKSVVFVGRGTFGNGRDGLVKNDGKQRGATNTVDSTSNELIGFTFDEPKYATTLEGISGRGDSGGPALITLD